MWMIPHSTPQGESYQLSVQAGQTSMAIAQMAGPTQHAGSLSATHSTT